MSDLKIKFNGDLELRLLQLKDAKILFALTDKNRANLRVWLGWVDRTKSVEDSRKFIQIAKEGFEKGEQIHFGIWFNNELVGVVSFHQINKVNKIGEIGYWLEEDFQGKGIMTKSVRTLVNYGFDKLDLIKVNISIAAQNLKSLSIPIKLGFTREKILKNTKCLYCDFRDHEVYAILAKEWKG